MPVMKDYAAIAFHQAEIGVGGIYGDFQMVISLQQGIQEKRRHWVGIVQHEDIGGMPGGSSRVSFPGK